MGEMSNAYRILVENVKVEDNLHGLGVDGIIVLNWP
jgi:hypothetical protein